MGKPLLDEYCKNIFSVFLVSEKTLRFNELYRTLNNIGLKMSKPTLIEHLRHLLKHRLLIRKKEGKQNVSYEANWTKLATFKQSMKTKQFIKNLLGNEKQFKTYPIDEQVTYVTNIMTLSNLYQLKIEVQDVIDPSKTFENSVQFLFINRFFKLFKTWLLQSCHASKTEKTPEALSTIDYNITRITNTLFDKKSQKHVQSQ